MQMIWQRTKASNLKAMIIPIIIILAASAVLAYEKCGNQIYVNQNCSMVTPIINCSVFDYDIYNASNELIVDNAPLVEVNESIFYFNWTLVSRADTYLVKLCDGTSREIDVVNKEDTSMFSGLFLIPLIFGFLIAIVAWIVGDKHRMIRWALIFFAVVMVLPTIWLANLSLMENYPGSVELSDALGTLTQIVGVMVLIFAVYILIITFISLLQVINERKKAKEDKY